MVGTAEASRRLANRLRELRTHSAGVSCTQGQLANAIGASSPLVSAWENANAVPPEERLKAYARVFASSRVLTAAVESSSTEIELSADEEHRRRELVDELINLREEALARPVAEPAGGLGGRFWYFPGAKRIRIITTRFWASALDGIPYANPWHPNYLQTLWDADHDASLELFGHLRAENPTADVRFLDAESATSDDLTSHIIILGQGDSLLASRHASPPDGDHRQTVLEYLARRLELPFGTRLREGGDREFDSEFVVTVDESGNPRYYPYMKDPAKIEIYRPVFLRDEGAPGRPRRMVGGYPQLEYDVAVLARMPNALNLATTVTICSGIFSRGTYGAVRALTDVNMRARNEAYLRQHLDVDNFWLLLQVPVFSGPEGAETLTPDLQCPLHRLRGSS